MLDNLTDLYFFYYIYMIILEESGSAQTFNFIPRSYTSGVTYTIKINNESTNKEIFSATSTSFTAVDYYFQYSNTFNLKEDTFYTLEITDPSGVVFKDKIFCTNQVISTYSINNNAYTINSDANEFILI